MPVTPRVDVALAATGLWKRYGRRDWALRGVDLAIHAGVITALVGPNAAGKSTLIKSWMGFETPTSGSVLVQGIDPIRDRSAALRRLAYLPQTPSLYRGLTIEEHLLFVAHHRPKLDVGAARRWLDRMAIPTGARPTELSGGQAAQVGLAIALASHVEVLLLDEPLASLDPLARHEFLEVLRAAVTQDGTTVLLSSHIVGDIAQVCDWIVVLGAGATWLDQSIIGAKADHRFVAQTQMPSPADAVGELPGGGFVIRSGGVGRPASLDEIVLAYLARARRGEHGTTLDHP